MALAAAAADLEPMRLTHLLSSGGMAALLLAGTACSSTASDSTAQGSSRDDLPRVEMRGDRTKRTTTTVKGTGTIGLVDLDSATTTTAARTPTTTATTAATTTPVPASTAASSTATTANATQVADAAALELWSTWMDDVSAQVDEVVAFSNEGDVYGVIIACGVGSALAAALPPQIQTDFDLNNYLRQAAAATEFLFDSCAVLDPAGMDLAARAIEEAFVNASTRAVIVARTLPSI